VLKFVNNQEKLNQRHVKWVNFSYSYTFVLKPKSRKDNEVINALSKSALTSMTMENGIIGF
jgi:hypothetical protein